MLEPLFHIHSEKIQALSIFDWISIEFADIFLCYVATLGDYLGRIIFIASQMNCKLYWASCEGII